MKDIWSLRHSISEYFFWLIVTYDLVSDPKFLMSTGMTFSWILYLMAFANTQNILWL